MCVFTVCGPLVCLTFACRVILFGQRNVVNMPVNIGVGDGGTYPQKFVKKSIFAGKYYIKLGHFSRKNRVRFKNIVTISGK